MPSLITNLTHILLSFCILHSKDNKSTYCCSGFRRIKAHWIHAQERAKMLTSMASHIVYVASSSTSRIVRLLCVCVCVWLLGCAKLQFSCNIKLFQWIGYIRCLCIYVLHGLQSLLLSPFSCAYVPPSSCCQRPRWPHFSCWCVIVILLSAPRCPCIVEKIDTYLLYKIRLKVEDDLLREDR